MLRQLAVRYNALRLDWMPGSGLLAQLCHFFIGTTLMFGTVALGSDKSLGAALVLTWVIAKEFIYDILFEHDSWADGIIDGAFCCLGALAALILLSIHERSL